MILTVGVDIGGTKLIGGVVDDSGKILATARRESPAADPEAIEMAITEVVADLRREHEVAAVGVGAAGFVDARRARVLFAPNLAWRDEPLKQDLEARIGLPVVVENDANAAAWGEYRFGVGASMDVLDLVLVTVGTGIGGGLIMNGQLHRGAFGIAAEFGHMCVVPDGRICGCGNRGCWEQYASGNALVRETQAQATRQPDAARTLLTKVGGDISSITGPDITEVARSGDPFAVAQLTMLGSRLGEGLANLAAAFDPGMIVIGGGVSEAGDLIMEPALQSFRRHLTGGLHRPLAEIRLATLGNAAGLVGAADLARVI